jgi:hypothetical protein
MPVVIMLVRNVCTSAYIYSPQKTKSHPQGIIANVQYDETTLTGLQVSSCLLGYGKFIQRNRARFDCWQ